MKYTFMSRFADDIRSYIQLRKSLGNQEETFARRLGTFDVYCATFFPDEPSINREICESWCTLKEGESLTTLRLRTGILRDFTKYLNSIGKEAYVIPDGYTGKSKPYFPYLYSDEELSDFFRGADSLGPHKLSPCREYVVPVLFRMLFCCGLRPQEIPSLTLDDVDLEKGTIAIRDSKRNKDRIVPMSSDMLELCRSYDRFIGIILPVRTYFFQCKPDKNCSIQWIQAQFHKCWKRVGKDFSKDHHPRVYDFRHNFATRVIRKWMLEGQDVMCRLPYLSSYMGHASIEYTAYYIHLIPEHLSELGKAVWNSGIEVPSYEN